MAEISTTPAAEEFEVPHEKRPRHIAIIMDGNGRWAQRQNLPRIEGHRNGVASVRCITEECSRLGIGQLTLFCLSSENWKRPQTELDFLMHLLEQYMIEERTTIMNNNIRVNTIGLRDDIAEPTLREMDKTIGMSAENTGMELCLAINYGARREIVDATRKIAQQVQAGQIDWSEITEEMFADHLDTAGMPDPDLLLRTAGEKRISNFLLWQISYSEVWYTEKCWPEFREPDLHQAVRDFAARERRFGGLSG